MISDFRLPEGGRVPRLVPKGKACRTCKLTRTACPAGSSRGTLLAIILLLSGCVDGGDMHDQPRYEALEASVFFEDGKSARPIPQGTVARGERVGEGAEVIRTGRRGDRLVERVPLEVTSTVLERGRERFNIYCTPCHGYDGTGYGFVVQRGYTKPPSLHIERLRVAPAGYLFSVISDGFGRMPSYAPQVPIDDRWAIIAYIRALQLSGHADASQLPADLREQLEGGAR